MSEKQIAGIIMLVLLVVLTFRLSKLNTTASKDHLVTGGLGVLLMLAGHCIGLFVAPKEAMMGDVGRILYVHVPTAWTALVTFLIAFIVAIASLWSGKRHWDAGLIASVEVGVLFSVMLTLQGSIWAKPTWNTWWTWDPRLTTTAIMVLSFAGLLILRKVMGASKRAGIFMAVGTIIAFTNVPIVYFSVKWWNTLHQNFSSTDTISSPMILPLRLAAFGMLFLMCGLILARARQSLKQLEFQDHAPDLPPERAPLDLEARTGDLQ